MFFIFSKIPIIISLFENFFEIQKAFHQNIFAKIPFSVGDVFYILLGILLIYIFIKILKKESRRIYILKFLIVLNILYFVYQMFWGMLYFQKPLLEKLPEKEVGLREVKSLTLKYLEKCKISRNLVTEDQNGVFLITNFPAVEKNVLNNQTKIPISINNKSATEINSFKKSLFRSAISYSGILGYYNPFTAEAQYNANLPHTYLPFTLAHESAHQLGYAREQEANFIGFLIGYRSANQDLKYSTDYFVLKSLLNSLIEKNPEFVQSIIQDYSPGMKRDREAEKLFIEKHAGLLDVFFGFTNDLFLKSNQQDGSITYSYFIDLLLRYEES
ncbi:DUF3810 domain-containing protein [Kaistella polysaccharea]|uniref:DUF3810 domain-containing protein n=1 Tax=Kaistella polysaccharea TaxID=2878534 RepID=UPI001CF19A02|nr:DUF3810 domain-containing protein [Kaistella polysaccharea]